MLPFLREYLHGKLRDNVFPYMYIDNQRIMQSDSTRAFKPVTCKPQFSRISSFYRQFQHNQCFYFISISANSIKKLQKPICESFLISFLPNEHSLKKSGSIMCISPSIPNTMQTFKKTNGPNCKKTSGQTESVIYNL